VTDVAGTIERVAIELGTALRQIGTWLSPDEVLSTLASFGVAFPPQLLQHAGFAAARQTTADAAEEVGGGVQALVAAIEAEDVPAIVQESVRTLTAIKTVIESFDDFTGQLQVAGQTMPGVTPAQLAELTNDFPRKLLDFVITEQMDVIAGVGSTLTLAGLIERTYHFADPANPTASSYETAKLRLDRLGELVTSPETHFQGLYEWGSPTFDGDLLFPVAAEFFARLGLPARVVPASGGQPARLEAFAVDLTPTTSVPPGLDVDVMLPVGGGLDFTVPLPHPDWQLHLKGTAQVKVGTGGTIEPPLSITLRPPEAAEITGEAEVAIEGRPSSPFVLIGVAGGSRLEIGAVDARGGFEFRWDPGSGEAAVDPFAGARLQRGKLVVASGEADGFISTLLSGFGLEAGFDAELAWGYTTGVRFTGSATIEIALAVHASIGPLEVPTIYVILRIEGEKFPLELAADMKAKLGPLVAVVSRLGMRAEFSFPASGGNLGPAQLDFAFKPPTGVGLSVDAGVVKGGGFLYFDPDREEYGGALELVFSGFLTLSAIGIVTTRMPDGSRGFSLLIIITAEFGTGIQLGFGFTLLGVGGLLGLNRTMLLQPLVEGVRTGAVNRILFPRDVVANAPQIISDLRTFFPPRQGVFLIGPMAKLGWGTPTLVSLSVGVIIEIPGNVAILGVLRIALPAEEAPVVVIQVSFVGAVEFDRKRFYFFASLFESRILFITIEGELAVLAAFGDDANFVLSVGGFHPRFDPPPLPVPTPRRIALNLINEELARVRVEGYFAVTTNTAQFGARVDAMFGVSAFKAEASLTFDALLQFSPFYFVVEISASFSVRVFGIGAFSVRVRLSLEGPTPWRARGTGSISLLFFDISVDFAITWGEERDTALPPITVMPLLFAELNKQEAWRAILPAGTNLLVSLRELDPTAELVLHPVGTLRVTQRFVPLDLVIDKVGNQRPTDAKRFSLTVTGGGLAKRDDALESFAPAQFRTFSDAEKLSKPAYEPYHGGIDLSASGPQLASGAMVKRVVRYELITIDTNYRRFVTRFHLFFGVLFEHFLGGASVTYSAFSKHNEKQLQPFDDRIAVQPETYTVAYQADNAPYSAEADFPSEAMARDYLAEQVEGDPALAGELHVLSGFEVSR
jgi:hypothetical protein